MCYNPGDMTSNIPYGYADDTKVREYIDKYNVNYVLNDFISSKTTMQPWIPVIDADMYSKALIEFIKYGTFIHFPTKYIYSWIGIIMKNTAILLADTILYGNGNYLPIEECEDFMSANNKEYIKSGNWKDCYEALDNIGLFKWMRLPDKSIGLSDFGIKPIIDILCEYEDSISAEKAFTVVNKCLDISHRRGDLSSIFIEGGKEMLDKFK